MLQLAESHSRKLNHFDLMVLFTGASAHFALGMREWLKQHRKQLDPEATAVISIDNVGDGELAYAVKEGPIFASRMHPTLAEIAGEVGGNSYESREISDAYLSRSGGLPTLRISTTGREGDDEENRPTVVEFTAKLLEQIDAEIGPDLR